jgi:hypothetical protein
MTIREKAEQLRQEGIKELLNEKKAIEEMLKTLGYDAENKSATKRRDKMSKDQIPTLVQEEQSPMVSSSEA